MVVLPVPGPVQGPVKLAPNTTTVVCLHAKEASQLSSIHVIGGDHNVLTHAIVLAGQHLLPNDGGWPPQLVAHHMAFHEPWAWEPAVELRVEIYNHADYEQSVSVCAYLQRGLKSEGLISRAQIREACHLCRVFPCPIHR